MTQTRHFIHDLLKCPDQIVEELNLRDGPQAPQRHTDRSADNGVLGDSMVPHAFLPKTIIGHMESDSGSVLAVIINSPPTFLQAQRCSLSSTHCRDIFTVKNDLLIGSH